VKHPTICSVLIATPDGWESSNVYSAYDIALPKGYERAGHPPAMVYYHGVSGTHDLEPANLRNPAYTCFLVDPTWEPPVDVNVGEHGWHGHLVLGHGKSLVKSEGAKDAFAIVIDVPGRTSVFLLATWLASQPELAQPARDMARSLVPCAFQPGRGCVPEP
jgi:hypothetical protein